MHAVSAYAEKRRKKEKILKSIAKATARKKIMLAGSGGEKKDCNIRNRDTIEECIMAKSLQNTS